MYYYETGSLDPSYNLAFEEFILNNKTEGDCLILWQNDKTVVIGQNQNTEEEVNQEFIQKHGIKVVRRSTGGGAVYHDLGNLNYSFITDLGNAEELSMEKFTLPVVKALQKMNLPAESSGRNDILVNGKKVSGTAQRIVGKRVLFHGTLLFDADTEMMAGALHVDPEKYRSKSTKSVRSRVGSIKQELEAAGHPAVISDFRDSIKKELSESFQEKDAMIRSWITTAEQQQIMEIKQNKYDTWEWTYGKNPVFETITRKRFEGGTVELCRTVSRGFIKEIRIFGDFLSLCPLDGLEKDLIGCKNDRDSVREILSRFDLHYYFGSISLDEILTLI